MMYGYNIFNINLYEVRIYSIFSIKSYEVRIYYIFRKKSLIKCSLQSINVLFIFWCNANAQLGFYHLLIKTLNFVENYVEMFLIFLVINTF